MFSGIITNLGRISAKEDKLLQISANQKFLDFFKKGDSISVNGICLTVIQKDRKSFAAEFMPETEKKTNLKYLTTGNIVNLELPATPNSFLSGHIVQGHVDTISRLTDIKKKGNSRILKFETPLKFLKYIVEKGSISVNGISLTVISVGKNFFTCGIIPHTWKNTMVNTIRVGDFVNIEVDILGKYLEKLIKR